MAAKSTLALPGHTCIPDDRRSGPRMPHQILAPEEDADLQRVASWLVDADATTKIREAVDDAIRYVLDGARTWRFALTDSRVDSDERSTVGTKLQYHVIEELGLVKEPPLDTSIVGIPVEIKGTVRRNWMIPREGQCEITLMIQIDADQHRFRAFLMRTHRAWLTGIKGNRDLKRTIQKAALDRFALSIVEWTPLPSEPLRQLTAEQLAIVFGKQGQARRLTALFGYLPETVIPRPTIETVCAKNQDPMRRARQAKEQVLQQHGLVILVGKWQGERELAKRLGFDLGTSSWVAVPKWKIEPEYMVEGREASLC
ncbi:NaeI family type II restriction endonuclease [Gordonia phthalatica]|uniref:NaeI family type II restriction endonuclease n=1 Tax=Gordonia phthalatica TaxID=1136941 RepID=UPI0009E7E8E6|nr:NaeI family type II restriction endonuclease [Gordonia phthalatica]